MIELLSERRADLGRRSNALTRIDRQRSAARVIAPNISFRTTFSPNAWGALPTPAPSSTPKDASHPKFPATLQDFTADGQTHQRLGGGGAQKSLVRPGGGPGCGSDRLVGFRPDR